MLKRVAIIFVLLFAVALPAAHAADSPALQVFKQWLDAFNSADATKMAAFWKKYGKNAADDHSPSDLRLRQMTQGMTIFKVVEDTGTHLVVLMKEGRGIYSESTMDLATTNPPTVDRISGHPVPPPVEKGDIATSDEDLAKKVRERVAATQGPNAFSGAILIAHHGKVVLDQAWGMADGSKQIPNTVDTQFCLGSMNKMFTSVAILQLVQQGKLSLDKPMATYWPNYPNKDLAAKVTIRELLSHTGGTGDIFTPEYEAHREEIRTLADYVKLFGDRPVRFEHGTQMEYSNYGFILLGRIIELVSGEPYQDYVRKHVYEPAGMLHTNSRPESDHVQGRAVGYVQGPNGLTPNTDTMSWSGTSAGGGYSTVGDLMLFAEALRSGKLIPPALLKEATTDDPTHRDYGLGFYVLHNGAYGHGGGAPGINGELHILPKTDYVLVALVNRDPPMASNMVDVIAEILPPQAGN
jgi:D-alanyl-D-alanine carboxypeptidase